MGKSQLTGMKKFQYIAGIAGIIGLILGTLLPGLCILAYGWRCPFGDKFLQIIGFLAVTGFGCAVVFGNLVAFLLIGIMKFNRTSRKSSRRRGE